MKELSQILSGICSDLGISHNLKLKTLKSQWEKIAGESISMHSEPWSLKDGILTLKVDSPQWMHEIKLHENLLIKKINYPEIREIKLRLGRINRYHLSTGKKILKKRCLNREESEYIEKIISEIKDTGLRDSIRKAMMRYFIRIKDRS